MASYIDYVNYFEKLSKDHVDIAHDSDGKKAFFLRSWEEVIAGVKAAIRNDSYIMTLMTPTFRTKQEFRVVELTFFILKKVRKGDYSEIMIVQDEADKIAMDCLTKMNDDSRSGNYDSIFFGSFDHLRKEDIIPVEMNFGGEFFYGVQINMELNSQYCNKPRQGKFL